MNPYEHNSLSSPSQAVSKRQRRDANTYEQALNEDESIIEFVILKTRSGITRSLVDDVAAISGLTDKEMARIVNMSIRSLHAKRPAEPLASDAAERLLLFQHLVQRGLAVFDSNKAQLTDWLRTPLAELAISPLPAVPREPGLSTRQMGRFEGPFDLIQRSQIPRPKGAGLVPETEVPRP